MSKADEFAPHLAAVGTGKSMIRARAGQVIYRADSAATSVYFLQSGRVKLTARSNQTDREAIVYVVEAGHFFGEGGLSGLRRRATSAATMEPSIIAEVTQAAVIRLMDTSPAFVKLLLTSLIDRAHRTEEALIDQLFNDLERRLARLLVKLSHVGPDTAPQLITGSISQEALAGMVGASRPRVSSIMNKFRKMGLIDYHADAGARTQIEVRPALLLAVLNDGLSGESEFDQQQGTGE